MADLMVLSEEPETTRRSRYWRQAMPRLCPLSVRTNSHVSALHTCNGQWIESVDVWRPCLMIHGVFIGEDLREEDAVP